MAKFGHGLFTIIVLMSDQKVIAALERISEAFKVLLQSKAKEHGLSPIQIQILLFVDGHAAGLSNVSQLAREFEVTKPTISDAVRVLHDKELLDKDFSSTDNRSYTLFLTKAGKAMVKSIEDYARPIAEATAKFPSTEVNNLYSTLNLLIHQLHGQGVLTVQRNCFSCRFYSKTKGKHHCALLETSLTDNEIRLDCAEHVKA